MTTTSGICLQPIIYFGRAWPNWRVLVRRGNPKGFLCGHVRIQESRSFRSESMSIQKPDSSQGFTQKGQIAAEGNSLIFIAVSKIMCTFAGEIELNRKFRGLWSVWASLRKILPIMSGKQLSKLLSCCPPQRDWYAVGQRLFLFCIPQVTGFPVDHQLIQSVAMFDA